MKADTLEIYRINDWWAIGGVGKYNVGDKVIYLEVGSWVPQNLTPFLTRGRGKTFKGIEGRELETISLRGQVSQGLLLPYKGNEEVGTDLTALLGVVKWKPETDPRLAGEMKGNFHSNIPKTRQERVQNVDLAEFKDTLFEVTEKLNGTSMTIYIKDGVQGVCSYNVDLNLSDESNSYVQMYNSLGLELTYDYTCMAIQGELIGPGIEGNQYDLQELEFRVFSVFDIVNQKFLSTEKAFQVCVDQGLEYVSILALGVSCPTTVEEAIKEADKVSTINNSISEGLVIYTLDGRNSFKVINNRWLLNEK